MQKKQTVLFEQSDEMFSINENIYDMFSIEQLEQRLQMSAAKPWCNPNCSSHNPDPCPPNNCPSLGCTDNMPICPDNGEQL